MIQTEINKKKTPLTSKFNLDLRKKRPTRCTCAEIWRLRKIVTKHLEILKSDLGEGLNK
jgi:hypothetical protein